MGLTFPALKSSDGSSTGKRLERRAFFAMSIGDVFFVLSIDAHCTLCVDNFFILFFAGANVRTIERRLWLGVGRVGRWTEMAEWWFSDERMVALHICW